MTWELCLKLYSSFPSISNEKIRFEELHFQNFTNRLSIQSDKTTHILDIKSFKSRLKIWFRGGFYNDHFSIKKVSGHKTDIAFQRYNLVTEEEMLGMKWLDLKKDEHRTMDTYMDTKAL